MVKLRGLLRRRIALALHGAHMEHHRAVQRVRPLQQPGQLRDVVAVHRADVLKAHVLEENTGQEAAFQVLFDAVGQGIEMPSTGDGVGKITVTALEAQVAGAQMLPRKQRRHTAHVLLDAHAVVIEHHQQLFAAAARVGQPLIGQTAGKRAVADQGDHTVILPHQRPRPRHTQRDRDGVGGVTRDKGVGIALVGLREAGQAAQLAQGGHLIRPPGEHFMGVTLVSHIEYQSVSLKVKDPVQRHGQLHRAQIGGQMAAGLGHRAQKLLPDLRADLSALVII